MKVFKSKVDPKLLIPILLVILLVTVLPFLNGAPTEATQIMILIMVATIAFILHLFFTTRYIINSSNQLQVKCGFIYNMAIDITKITAIHKTSSLFSAPAASLDRIEVKFGKWDSVVISPNDKVGFLQELLRINPGIEHDMK